MLVCYSPARERFTFLTLTPDSSLGFAIAAIHSVDSLLGPAITPRPVRALRTILSFGIVHAFFVGTADDAVGDYAGPDRVGLEEGHDLLADARYYWLLLAEGHLTRRRFGAMLGQIALLPAPTG